jgi:hypothetical protein
MTKEPARSNLFDINIIQFDNIDEALANTPEHLILQWINAGWRNMQMRGVANAVRLATRKYDRAR